MDKAQRIEAMRRLLPRNSKAQTVRGIARWLKGCGRERYALNGYARVESRDAYHQARKGKRKDWYAAQSRRRYDARYMRLGALTCDALGHVARDTQQELIAAGVSTRAVKALGRLGVDRRAARIAAWLSAPARAVALRHTRRRSRCTRSSLSTAAPARLGCSASQPRRKRIGTPTASGTATRQNGKIPRIAWTCRRSPAVTMSGRGCAVRATR